MVRGQGALVALEYGFLELASTRQVALLKHRVGEVQARGQKVGVIHGQGALAALEDGFKELAGARQVTLLPHRDGEVQARVQEVGVVRRQVRLAMIERHCPCVPGRSNGSGSVRRKAELPRRIRDGLAHLETLYVPQRTQRVLQQAA